MDPNGPMAGAPMMFCVEVHSGESFGELAILGFVKRRSAVVRAKAQRGSQTKKAMARPVSTSINQYISQ